MATKELCKRSIRAEDHGFGQTVSRIDFDLNGQSVDADQSIGGEFGKHILRSISGCSREGNSLLDVTAIQT